MAGLEPLVAFWTGWGIHLMVLVSFTVQVTLLLVSDIRRRRDWAVLKVVIWSAYMLADTTAIYALGHMSVVCRSPEHHLMALWAPLLLVHLGGQDNITAYAIEDNRLWLRHLQTFVLQVAAAGYVLYVSSILSHPSSKVSLAAMLMFVVGVLKYGERIWALKRANSCASSSLSATSYDKVVSVSRTAGEQPHRLWISERNKLWTIRGTGPPRGNVSQVLVAYSLLYVPKQMFEGPTTYVQIRNVDREAHKAKYMLGVVKMQVSMMYDLLYTKAAVVHTWYGLCSRVLISLPFTVAALALFCSSPLSNGGDEKDAAAAAYKRADVAITIVLLVGAVVLETMSVLRAIFSKWTAVLLYGSAWYIICTLCTVFFVCVRSEAYWSGRMRQHSLFKLRYHSNFSRGSKVAKRVGVEDWWDSNVYSWSIEVPELAITKVLELVSTTEDITKSQGLNALRRSMNNNNIKELVTCILRTMEELKLEERILVWHIATHVYLEWYELARRSDMWAEATEAIGSATKALANYMFFLLAARPYMLPYPVSRQAYVQLCHDAVTQLRYCNVWDLLRATLKQHKALTEGTPLQPCEDIRPHWNKTGTDGAEPQPSMNTTLDRGCQLAAKLIHITAKETKRVHGEDITMPILQTKGADGKGIIAEQAESTVNGEDIITEQAETFSVNVEVILNMLLEVWVEMLCYTAYLCNENSHAKHLTDGAEFMTIITLLMIYMKNGLIRKDNISISGGTVGPSSQGAGATDIDTDIDSVV